MAKLSRITLKDHFDNGKLPNAQHYRDFIDSSVNKLDDGFDKTEKYGLRLASQGESKALISFDIKNAENKPFWIIKHGGTSKALHFQNNWKNHPQFRDPYEDHTKSESRGGTGASKKNGAREKESIREKEEKKENKTNNEPTASVLTLSETGKVGIYTDLPKWQLDVDGVVRSHGRIGFPRVSKEIQANGEWEPITGWLKGCHALEIVAGVGGEQYKGRYSLLHATATNAYNPRSWILNFIFSRRKIRQQTAVFGRVSDRIKLRWESKKDSTDNLYRLEMKSASKIYSNEKEKTPSFIRYYITQLWFDTEMEDSRKSRPQALDPKNIIAGQIK